MRVGTLGCVLVAVLTLLSILVQGAVGIRFEIDREECFSHTVQYDGDQVHVSFVVIRAQTAWYYGDEGVHLVITGPSGEQIQDFHDKKSEKFEFIAQRRGIYQFCFKNKSPYHEIIDLDVHVGHYFYHDQHAKNEHLSPLMEQILMLEEALYKIQYEQHWLEAQTVRQALVNEGMKRATIHKAIFECAALFATSSFQVYLLKRMLEQKFGTSRFWIF